MEVVGALTGQCEQLGVVWAPPVTALTETSDVDTVRLADEIGEELGELHANPCATLLRKQLMAVTQRVDMFQLDPLRLHNLDRTIATLLDVQGGCERIKNTPLLRPYDYYPRIFVYVYTFFLPFAIVQRLGWMTFAVSLPVSFLFYVLSRVGASVEDPFESRITDVPLDALCRTIEISLREQAGDTDLPSPLEPIDGFLS